MDFFHKLLFWICISCRYSYNHIPLFWTTAATGSARIIGEITGSSMIIGSGIGLGKIGDSFGTLKMGYGAWSHGNLTSLTLSQS